MGRRVAHTLVWEDTGDGERAGPYSIRLEAANRWQLLVDGHLTGVWFLPVFVVSFGIAFGAFTRAIALLLTVRR